MPESTKTNPNSNRPVLRRPSIVTNAISNWAAMAINIVVGFILTPYIVEHLGTAQYGIWALVLSVIGYYGLLDLGVSSAVVRYVARYAGQHKYESLNQVINTSITIFSIAGFIAIAVSILAAEPLAKFFNVEAHNYLAFKQCIWLLGITAGLMLPGNVLGVALIGHERFVIRNTIQITISLLRCGLSMYVLYKGGKLLELCWINFGLGVFRILINLAVLKLFFRHIILSPKLVNKSMFSVLFSFGFLTSIVQVGNMLKTKLDAILIGRYLDMDSVGLFSIAALLCFYLSTFIKSCSGVSQPRLATLAGQDNNKIFSRTIIKYSIIISNMVACGGLALYLLNEDFLRLWIPENIANIPTISTVVSIILLMMIPDLMVNVSFNALLAVKKHQYYAYQTVAEGIAHLIISIILVRWYGIYGVVLGGAIPTLLTRFFVQPIYCSKILGLNWWDYMLKTIIKPCLLMGGIILFVKYSGISISATSYFQLIIKGLLILSVYTVISYFFCLDKDTQREVTLKIARIKSRVLGLLNNKGAVSEENING